MMSLAKRYFSAVVSSADSARENNYWLENFGSRPYVMAGADFKDYAPAYRYGLYWYERSTGRSFEDLEAELSRHWNWARGLSRLRWDQAKPAARDAWDRLRRSNAPATQNWQLAGLEDF